MQAVIFDMDGVIVDSEHQWKLAERPFLSGLIPSWCDADHEKVVGLGVVDLYHHLVKEYGIKQPQEAFLAHCQILAEEVYARKVSQSEGILELISDLKQNKVLLGLASSSPRSWIDIVLARFNLGKEFSAIASGDEVPGRTKPQPDIYLLAAKKLGVSPERCVAIEDSVLGVLAAKRAGLFCAGFRSGYNDEQDLSKSDMEFRHFRELSYARLMARLKLA